MSSRLKCLAIPLLLIVALSPLNAQVPIATFTCSGNGQPTISMPAYAFNFQVEDSGNSQFRFGFVVVAPSQVPTLLAAAASGAVYGSCSIGDGTDSLPLPQVGIANASFGEYGAGVGSPDSLSYGLVQVIYVSDHSISQHASTHLTYRSVSPLNRQLDALISRARAAHYLTHAEAP